jgi:hypothetical protein
VKLIPLSIFTHLYTSSEHIHILWPYSHTLSIFTYSEHIKIPWHPLVIFTHSDYIRILWSYWHPLTIFTHSDYIRILWTHSHPLTIHILWLYSHIHILWLYSHTLAIFTYADYIHILWELKSLLVANNNSIFLQYLICLISGIRNITCLESCVALVDLSLSRNEVLHEERRSVCVCVKERSK